MKNLITGFLKDEDGVGVIEIVIILAALVAIALVFKKSIINLFTKLWKGATGKADVNVETDITNMESEINK